MLTRLIQRRRRPFLLSHLVFGALAAALLIFLPTEPSARLWGGALATLLAPSLVIGRSQRWRSEGMSATLLSTPSLLRWQLIQLQPALLIVCLAGLVIGRGSFPVALLFILWGTLSVFLADTFDRRLQSFGQAWCWTLLLQLGFLSAPLWGGIWFGRTFLSPWLATLCINLNPVIAGLAAAGRPTLQDPVLYQLTLSGIVEVRPLPWWSCAIALTMLCLTLLLFNFFSEPQPLEEDF